MPFAIEQPLHSCSSPLRVTPICLAVLRRAPRGHGRERHGGVDVSWGTSVVGLRPGRIYSIGLLIIKCTGAIRIQEV